MKSPVSIMGSKNIIAKWIVSFFPEHRHYVEVFGGGAAVLFEKPRSKIETYNDLDSGLVNFFRVLRDPQMAELLVSKLEMTPYSREEWFFFRDTWSFQHNQIEKAYRWFYVSAGSFGGFFGRSFGTTKTPSRIGMSKSVSAYRGKIARLLECSHRLLSVQVEQLDFRKILYNYDTPTTFFYLDPPYIAETRRDGFYEHEMTDIDHKDLVDLLLSIKGKAILSGYDHPIYSPLAENGWQKEKKETYCWSAGKTNNTGLTREGSLSSQKRVETLYISPNSRKQLSLFEG